MQLQGGHNCNPSGLYGSRNVIMLYHNLSLHYYVYPSWLTGPVAWEDLPAWVKSLPAHPKHQKFIHSPPKGYPPEALKIGACRLIDGPCGGGIVVADVVPGFGWEPLSCVYQWVHNGSGCDIYVKERWSWMTIVTWLEQQNECGWELGVGRKFKSYPIWTSEEHVQSAGDRVFWLIRQRKDGQKIPHIEAVPAWARSFGVSCQPLPGCPAEMALEMAPALQRISQKEPYWFEIKADSRDLGLYLSVVDYIGLHLAKVSRAQMGGVHVLAATDIGQRQALFPPTNEE